MPQQGRCEKLLSLLEYLTAGEDNAEEIYTWVLRWLAYPIQKVHKAHYVLMNIETDQKTLAELTGAFRFSDAVLRLLVVKMDEAVTEPSPMAKGEEEDGGRHRRDDDDNADRDSDR